MWRRLYLTFPDSEHARQVSDELQRDGIKREQLHAMSRDGGALPGLPPASAGQQQDRVWFWERLYWNANLALFGVALFGFVVALFNGAAAWALFAAAVMLFTFLGGNYFVRELPHAHLNEMREPLQHGEVVLMVDLPPQQLQWAEAIVRRHPEAGGNVVGWTVPGLGM
ncbi:MAG: hypothetical protein OQL08_12010 [Gammaproteobacteria bacterium]|nr:hypothetical protein [Gammaproteobacteria bacterium]